MKKDFSSAKFRVMLVTSSFTLAIQFLMLLSDNFIVGNIVGQQAVAAMSLITPLATIVTFVSLVNSVGSTISRARALGSFEKRRADEFYSQGLILSILIGAAMFLLFLFGQNIYFSFFGASETVTAYAREYCRFYMLLILLNPLNSFLSNIILAEGEVFLCNISYIAQIFGNIGLSLFFALHIGIAGASLGSLLTVACNMFILCLHYLRKDNQLKFYWHLNIKDMIQAANRSVADAVSNLLWAVLFFIYSKFVIRMYGDEYLPALTVIINVIQFTMMFRGLGMAMRSFIGIFVSEKNMLSMRRMMNHVVRTAAAESVMISAFFLIGAGVIPYCFGIRDAEIIRISAICIRILSITLICYALGFLFSAYYLTLDKRCFSWIITILKEFFVPLCCSLGFGVVLRGWGIIGMSVGLSVGSFLGLEISMLIIYTKKGDADFPFLLEPGREKNIFAVTFPLNTQALMHTLDEMEAFMIEKNVPLNTIAKIRLIGEETGIAILNYNKGSDVLAEYCIDLNDGVKFITRDDGAFLNITDPDAPITSLNTFTLSSIMEHHPNRFNIVNAGYNRNSFRLLASKQQ